MKVADYISFFNVFQINFLIPASSYASFFRFSLIEMFTGCPPATGLSEYPGKLLSFLIFLQINDKFIFCFCQMLQ